MKEIPNFSEYYLLENSVVRKKDNKVMPVYADSRGTKFFKLKSDLGTFVKRSQSSIISLVYPPKPPEGFVKVPKYDNLYISKNGDVWAEPTTTYPLGVMLQLSNVENKYPTVKTTKSGTVEIHKLLALTFIDSEYIEKGLCVMHLDDDKTNYALSNLKIGTYSENIKSAYANGLNPGNGLRK